IRFTSPCILGVYPKPSLSVWPGPAVTSGETITMQCSSSLGFGRFILTQEGKHHHQWTLDSQQSANREFQAHFVLDPVTIIHNGTFRCYGCFRNHPQLWSKSSDPLHLSGLRSKYPELEPPTKPTGYSQVLEVQISSLHLSLADSKDQSHIHTENEPTASQHKSHTVENLIRMIMAALVLVTLVILLLVAWHSKKMEQDTTRR
ncbi:leukocyte immunoglobulin-like receptor subfamily A member 5, partial [Peromyscus leucopus]|uniref:leukocyte immunoglobulin-like receptor subfamily A member 5 n=1 Tax=Peromyscus leucopus TaxID=10041 RepID=UPI001884C701